jgi:hypothetical protein
MVVRKQARVFFGQLFLSQNIIILTSSNTSSKNSSSQMDYSQRPKTHLLLRALSRLGTLVKEKDRTQKRRRRRLDKKEGVLLDPIKAKGRLFFHAFWRERRGVFSLLFIRQSLDHTFWCRKKKARGSN